MQVLWSRTARAQSCRCTTCLHSATTSLARRTTTASPRRRAKFGDVITVFYSAILATAAVADAKVKDNRRRQWDQAIAEARGGVDGMPPEGRLLEEQGYTLQLESDEKPYELKSIFSNYERMFGGLPPLQSTLNGASPLCPPQSRATPLEKKLKILDSHLRQSFAFQEPQVDDADELGIYHDDDVDSSTQTWWSAAVEKRTADGAGLQQSVDYEAGGSFSQSRDPKKIDQVVMMEKMVAELVTQLLLNTKAFSTRKGSGKSTPGKVQDVAGTDKHSVEDIIPESRRMSDRWELLTLGRMGRTRLPSYTGLRHSGDWGDERAALHSSLESIFSSKKLNTKLTDLMIAKICYSLLTATAPPNIDTYNMMIEHFTKLHDHASAKIVIHSFFNRSKLRANERTIVAVLEHYALTKDSKGFRETIRRMRGTDGDFRLKKRHQDLLYQRKNISWALTHKVAVRDGHLYEKVKRTSKIFESLIYGAWERLSLADALKYYKASILEAQPLPASLFVDLVKGCLDHRSDSDWLSLKLLRNYLCHWRHESYASNPITSDPVARKHVYLLLEKVGIVPPSKLRQVGWLPEPPHWLPIRPFRDSFNDMMRQMHIERLDEMLNASVEVIAKLKSVVGNLDATVVTTEDPLMPSDHKITELSVVEGKPASASDVSKSTIEEVLHGIDHTLIGLGTKIALGRLDPSVNYIERLSEYDLSPLYTIIVTDTPVGKRFAATITLNEHSETFGVSSVLFTSETLAKQYASLCTIERLSNNHLESSLGSTAIIVSTAKKPRTKMTLPEMYPRLTQSLRSHPGDELGRSIPIPQAFPQRPSELQVGSAVIALTAGSGADLMGSKEAVIGGSFTAIHTPPRDPHPSLISSAPVDPSSRLQAPTRRFQVIEYRPRLSEYSILDRPTSIYAKAGSYS